MENDLRLAPRRLRLTARPLRVEREGSVQKLLDFRTLFIMGCQHQLVWQLKEYFQDCLNPTITCSMQEADSGRTLWGHQSLKQLNTTKMMEP